MRNELKSFVRTKRGIAAIVLVLLALGLILGAPVLGNNAAKSYKDSFASWKKDSYKKVTELPASLPVNTFMLDNETAKESIEKQKTACATLEAARDTSQAELKNVPKLGFVFLGQLSGSYNDTKKVADELSNNIDTYLKKAQSAYAQATQDCKWNSSANETLSEANAVFVSSGSLLQKRGETQEGATCTNADACIPENKQKRAAYAAAIKKAVLMLRTGAGKILDSDECSQTSFKQNCGKLKAISFATYDASDEYANKIEALPRAADNPTVDTIAKAYADSLKEADRKMIELFKAVYPKYATASVEADGNSTDAFFLDANQGRLKELEPARGNVVAL